MEKSNAVGVTYAALRNKAINFEFKPGERLNESALTRELGVSRTPMREALNRLVAEGFLTTSPGQGFYCRSLQPDTISELYQLRCALESEAVLRAVECAGQKDIDALRDNLDKTEPTYMTCDDFSELARMDEDFHTGIARCSGNRELVDALTNVNERIRYVRAVNLRQLRLNGARDELEGLSAHRLIVNAVLERNTDLAVSTLRRHIERRSEEVVELVKLAYSELYVPQPSPTSL